MDRESGKKRVQNVLENFNSPFRPFLLASTSLGQEGLDFHYYCRKVVHWNLPHNPVDIEQREGRVNRYKCLAIRQNLAYKYLNQYDSKLDFKKNIWDKLFSIAYHEERNGKAIKKPDLIPFWHIDQNSDDENSKIPIERILFLYPYSQEIPTLDNLLSTLALYRLTFGQPRQEELVNALNNELSEDQIDDFRNELMINLCPYLYSSD